jgi:hypothetical protein
VSIHSIGCSALQIGSAGNVNLLTSYRSRFKAFSDSNVHPQTSDQKVSELLHHTGAGRFAELVVGRTNVTFTSILICLVDDAANTHHCRQTTVISVDPGFAASVDPVSSSWTCYTCAIHPGTPGIHPIPALRFSGHRHTTELAAQFLAGTP